MPWLSFSIKLVLLLSKTLAKCLELVVEICCLTSFGVWTYFDYLSKRAFVARNLTAVQIAI